MKILIDARLYGLEHAGLGRYTMNLVNNLLDLDKENEYILLLRKSYFNALPDQKNLQKILCDVQHYTLKEQIQIRRTIKSVNPDVIHFPHFNVPLGFKQKYVVTIHDMLMHKFKGKNTTNLPRLLYFPKRFAYNLVFNSAVTNAFKIIVPSNYVKSDLCRYYNLDLKKVDVTYEGVSVKNVRRTNDNEILTKYKIDKPFFVYTGNAYPHKNLSRAVEALVRLNSELKDPVSLVICSSRNLFTSRLQELVKTLNAEEYVKLLGFVPDEEVEVLYRKSLAFVYPSLEEGFGLPGLEAISCGTIALLSDIPVFREVYKEHGLYFNPYDFTSLFEQMKVVLQMDLDKRKKMVLEGKAYVKIYSWKKMVEQTLEIYKEAALNTSN